MGRTQPEIVVIGNACLDVTYHLDGLPKPGETLVLVTDGVTEAQDPKGALFGRDRILAEGEVKGGNATDVVDAIRDRVRLFEEGAEATDDLTVMAIRFLGQA